MSEGEYRTTLGGLLDGGRGYEMVCTHEDMDGDLWDVVSEGAAGKFDRRLRGMSDAHSM